MELQQYEKAIYFTNIGLSIADKNIKTVDINDLVGLYFNSGVLYSRVEDYSKARIYFEKVESIYATKPAGLII